MSPFDYHALTSIRDVKQYFDVDFYYSYFKFLRELSFCQFPGICDAYFLSRFINGLKSEIQVYVLQHHPSNVLDAYDLALVKEYSIKCTKKPQSTIEKPCVQVVLSNEDEESFIPSVTDSVVDDTCTTVNDYIVKSPSAIHNSPMAGIDDLQTSVEDVSGSVYTPVSHTVLFGLSSYMDGFSSMDYNVNPKSELITDEDSNVYPKSELSLLNPNANVVLTVCNDDIAPPDVVNGTVAPLETQFQPHLVLYSYANVGAIVPTTDSMLAAIYGFTVAQTMDIEVVPAVKKDFSVMAIIHLNNSVNADDELQAAPWMAYSESCSIAQLGASLHVLDKRRTCFSWYSRVSELIVADLANFMRGFLITNDQSIMIDILPSKEDDKGGIVMLDTSMLPSTWVHGNVFHGNVPIVCASLETIASSTARKFSSDVSFTFRLVHVAPKDQPMFSLSWTYGSLFPVHGSISATLGAYSLNRFRRLSFAEGITVSSIPITPTPRRSAFGKMTSANFQVTHVMHVVFPLFVHDKTRDKGNGLRMDSSTDMFIWLFFVTCRLVFIYLQDTDVFIFLILSSTGS